MTKTRGLLFTAGLILATAFTFSCSDDDGGGGGGYLPCSEAVPLLETTIGDVENACKQNCYDSRNNSCFSACMEEDETVKKVCGGNDIKECSDHYKSTCKKQES